MKKFNLFVCIFLFTACAPGRSQSAQSLGLSADLPLPSNSATPISGAQAPGTEPIYKYVTGSSQKVCQLVGQMDRQLQQTTFNQTETRFGLVGNDLGYSFEHNGKLFFLFGDSAPTATFNGKPNLARDFPRIADDNDSIAFTSDTGMKPCLKLNFITDPIGAYKNPVVLNAKGQPAITLRAFEIPIAGISDGGKMYVIFGTDHITSPLSFATRSVVGESDDNAVTFHYLYDFSKGAGAKFINVAIAQGQDGYLYFWGTSGGALYRKSAPFLARKPVGSMNNINGIEYFHGLKPDGTPIFMMGEGNAIPIFHDYLADKNGNQQAADCMGELGVQWSPMIKRWMLLYNCSNDTPTSPSGIYMRLAKQPWGPWSPAQTVFNPLADGGYCHFIHRAVNSQNPKACDTLSDPGNLDVWGGVYGPYFLSRFTSGDSKNLTFYYTMSTWNPYTEVIMKSSIQALAQ
jgi:hypothetical protein